MPQMGSVLGIKTVPLRSRFGSECIVYKKISFSHFGKILGLYQGRKLPFLALCICAVFDGNGLVS